MEDSSFDEIGSAFDEFDGELPDTVDEAAIQRMQTVAKVLDEGMRVPGTNFRFGIDPIVGILPGAGDMVTAGVSLYIVVEAARLGVSQSTLVKMLASIAVDTVGGSVPVIGVVFDAFWKSNKWNVQMALEDLASGAGTEGDTDPLTVDIE